MNIAYLTDVEGNSRKLGNFLENHPSFSRGKDGIPHLLTNELFVHGGDVCDRFPGDHAVIIELLRLKKENSENVILIAGNRDINKLRIPLELSPKAMKNPPFRKSNDYAKWLGEKGKSDSRVSRLQWILAKTMNAPAAFDLRAKELAVERNSSVSRITEDDVVESYLEDLKPKGIFTRLLRTCVLAKKIDKTLFLHSGIPLAALGKIPLSKCIERSIDSWIDKLNDWYQSSLDEWIEGIDEWEGKEPPRGFDLIQYAEPVGEKSSNPISIVYGRTTDKEGKIKLPEDLVITWLKEQGIMRLVIGHTPSGQFPVIERSADGQFEIIIGDTSYSPRSDEAPLITFSGSYGLTTAISGNIAMHDEIVQLTLRDSIGSGSLLGKRLPDDGLLIAPFERLWIKYRVAPAYKVIYEAVDPHL